MCYCQKKRDETQQYSPRYVDNIHLVYLQKMRVELKPIHTLLPLSTSHCAVRLI